MSNIDAVYKPHEVVIADKNKNCRKFSARILSMTAMSLS